MSYEVKLSKYQGQMRWMVIERPTGSILCASTFEDKARDAENDFDDLDCTISDNIYWEKYPKEEDAA